jgi:hypothetical protein
MAPLPPDIDPPLRLEESARIGPAPVIFPPGAVDAEIEIPVAAGTEPFEADPPEDDTQEEPDDEEEAEEEEAYDDDLMAPDPFISSDTPMIEAISQGDIVRLRAEARAVALSGDHRILLSDIAGPGTLAEALNRLLQEGKVAAEFQDPEGEEPYLLYTPLPAPPSDAAPPADAAPPGPDGRRASAEPGRSSPAASGDTSSLS